MTRPAQRLRSWTSSSNFRRMYELNMLNVFIEHGLCGHRLVWLKPIEQLDLRQYLPMFVDGLVEREFPFRFLAATGCQDLIEHGSEEVIVKVVPQIILPLRQALNARDAPTVCRALKVIQHLLSCSPSVGLVLITYAKQLLPPLNRFVARNANLGDAIEYEQKRRENVADLTHETLVMLEKCGGENAYVSIKYMIPTYECHQL